MYTARKGATETGTARGNLVVSDRVVVILR